MDILGLDMSSKKTGWSYFKDGKLVDFGLWEITGEEEKDWRERIKYMASMISLFCEQKHINTIYAEDVPPITDNSQTVKVLSALQGMLISIGVAYNIDVQFIPVKTWKTKIGINLVSSRENIQTKKKVKANLSPKALTKLKGWTKAWEKKMSVDYANDIHSLDLVYKSPSSKFNQDDIADSINIVYSQIMNDASIYNLESFESIMQRFYTTLEESED